MEFEKLPLLLTDREVAKMLGVCRASVWNMARDGLVAAVRLRGSTRFTRASVLALAGIPAPPTPELEQRAG